MNSGENGASKRDAGKGLALPGLIIGLLTGLAAYGIIEFWIDGRDDNPLAIAALFFVITASAAYLLLAERASLFRALGGALAIAIMLALPDYFMTAAALDDFDNLSDFPAMFWFATSRGLVAYLLATLFKAGFEGGAGLHLKPAYRDVFFHGLTMPLIGGGALLFAGLAVVLLFAWARLLKELDVGFFNALFQEPWFLLPFIGAIGGLSIALIRGLQSVLGALRFILLLIARILMVITAVFTLTLLLVLATKGVAPVFDQPYPSALMLGLALAGMLIFNGVYQNGEAAPPPLWLRLPTLATLIGFPVYALIAFYAFWLRVGEYGLTPPRIAGLTVNGLVAAYSIVCLAGLASELNWRGKRWMPPVGSLNTAMAALWVAALILLATPLINPWAISARSQLARIADQRVAAADFDFGYLRFQLGRHGDKALDEMLLLEDHPEAPAIRDGVKRARSARNYWEYRHPVIIDNGGDETAGREPPPEESLDRPETLPINPGPDVDPPPAGEPQNGR